MIQEEILMYQEAKLRRTGVIPDCQEVSVDFLPTHPTSLPSQSRHGTMPAIGSQVSVVLGDLRVLQKSPQLWSGEQNHLGMLCWTSVDHITIHLGWGPQT